MAVYVHIKTSWSFSQLLSYRFRNPGGKSGMWTALSLDKVSPFGGLSSGRAVRSSMDAVTESYRGDVGHVRMAEYPRKPRATGTA